MPVTPRTPTIISEDTPFSEYSENGLRGYLNQHENDITDLQADHVGADTENTLTGKTINAPDNTVTNIKGENLSSGADFGASSKKMLNFVPRDCSALTAWDYNSSGGTITTLAGGGWATKSAQSIVGTSAVRVRLYVEWAATDARAVIMFSKGGTRSGTSPQNNTYTIQSLKSLINNSDAPNTGIVEVDLNGSQQFDTMYNAYGSTINIVRANIIGWYEPASTA